MDFVAFLILVTPTQMGQILQNGNTCNLSTIKYDLLKFWYKNLFEKLSSNLTYIFYDYNLHFILKVSLLEIIYSDLK